MGEMVLVGGILQGFMVNLILLKDGSHGKNSNTCMEHPAIGDFNEITSMAEKKGGSNRT